MSQVLSGENPDAKAVHVEYNGKTSYKVLAKKLGLMDDIKVEPMLWPSSRLVIALI